MFIPTDLTKRKTKQKTCRSVKNYLKDFVLFKISFVQ